MKVPFNRPYLSGREEGFIKEVLSSGKTGSGGKFYEKCRTFLQNEFQFPFVGMTNNCTTALEMSAFFLGIQAGDEVILPSYAYVTTANAFARFGANLRFADSLPDHPNIDPKEIEGLISPKTKAIVVLHYGGSCCDMDAIMDISQTSGIPVVEDAAHALGVQYNGKYAGSFGAFSAISFHETKNINCGEGGALMVNDSRYLEAVKAYFEHGTNRHDFEAGKVERYEWTSLGSSVKPAEINMAMLWAQLTDYRQVAAKRLEIAKTYRDGLSHLAQKGEIKFLPENGQCQPNGHVFAIVLNSNEQRKQLEMHLSQKGIDAYLHFGALHQSLYFKSKFEGKELKYAQAFKHGLLRLPVYPSLTKEDLNFIVDSICENFA